MSRMWGPSTYPPILTHIHPHGWTWGGGAAGSHGSVAFWLSIRSADKIIYNHFSFGSSDWCSNWPPNSLNLIICHPCEKLNDSRTFTHPSLFFTTLQRRPIWQTNQRTHDSQMASHSTWPCHLPKWYVSTMWVIWSQSVSYKLIYSLCV